MLCENWTFLFSECKKAEDEAIALINACGDERTVIMGNFRSFIDDLENEEDYDDYDYQEFAWLHDYD